MKATPMMQQSAIENATQLVIRKTPKPFYHPDAEDNITNIAKFLVAYKICLAPTDHPGVILIELSICFELIALIFTHRS